MTRAGLGLAGMPSTGRPAAHSMAAWMSASVPKHLPSTRSGSTRTPGARARHAEAVVGGRADQAGGAGAVPTARRRAAVREAAGTRFGAADPVTRVAGVVVAAVAVVGDHAVGDEVVTRQQRTAVGDAAEVGVLEAHAGVEHGHHDAGVARGACPGGFDVDRRRHRGGGRAQVPLAAGRTAALGSQVDRGPGEVQRVVGTVNGAGDRWARRTRPPGRPRAGPPVPRHRRRARA